MTTTMCMGGTDITVTTYTDGIDGEMIATIMSTGNTDDERTAANRRPPQGCIPRRAQADGEHGRRCSRGDPAHRWREGEQGRLPQLSRRDENHGSSRLIGTGAEKSRCHVEFAGALFTHVPAGDLSSLRILRIARDAIKVFAMVSDVIFSESLAFGQVRETTPRGEIEDLHGLFFSHRDPSTARTDQTR